MHKTDKQGLKKKHQPSKYEEEIQQQLNTLNETIKRLESKAKWINVEDKINKLKAEISIIEKRCQEGQAILQSYQQ